MQPTVEILLAAYNGERFLREQLDSLLAQTWEQWHLTVSDDGSTDGTPAILDEYAARYPGRIRRVRHEGRFGNARDHFFWLMKECGASYMMFCDQDDVWHLDKVEKTMRALLCLHWWRGAKDGRNNPLVAVCMLFTRYGFLIRQLVSRDFKTKYKRSALGMAWSFLNPLLTMSVQYVVFSTLFQSDIPNYPVYLLSGIVFFNFFSEAVSMGMTSITGNASLIKKVYMPKYIYPVSRILSSLVNFALAIIPLLLVMLITGTAFTPALLLLIFDMLCLLGFVTGMSLLLTTAMTFVQDTQFLWGVVSMMWMYLTPLFYPESIIPAQFLTVYHMNPMYQYITFARICIIDGVSPEPMAYLWCILSSVVVLGLGILTFKRHQDKFVLYL